MLQSMEEALRQLDEGRSLMGPGWREVPSFEEVEDMDEYEDEEEEMYAVLDMGQAMDARTLMTEGTYQLIGMETSMPFLKIGDHTFKGQVSPLIGTEVILGLTRDPENPQHPSHPPLYATSSNITFTPVVLLPRNPDGTVREDGKPQGLPVVQDFPEKDIRSMFLSMDAKHGPNAPTKEERELRRLEKKAERSRKEKEARRRAREGIEDDAQPDSSRASAAPTGEDEGDGHEEDEDEEDDFSPSEDDDMEEEDEQLVSIDDVEDASAGPSKRGSNANVKKSRGRPKNATRHPRIYVGSEAELAGLPFHELDKSTKINIANSDPEKKDRVISKLQAERIVHGLPPKGVGSRVNEDRERQKPKGKGKGKAKDDEQGGSENGELPTQSAEKEREAAEAPIHPDIVVPGTGVVLTAGGMGKKTQRRYTQRKAAEDEAKRRAALQQERDAAPVAGAGNEPENATSMAAGKEATQSSADKADAMDIDE